MKRVLRLLVLVLASSATLARAQSMGTLTQGGVPMTVKAAVAVLDDKPSLVVYLLPFEPTSDEIAKLQAGDILFWMSDKPSPDPKKWKSCPHGSFTLSWGLASQAIGDAKKANVYVSSTSEGKSLSTSKAAGEIEVALVGSVKAGQEVTLTSTGSDTVQGAPLSWNLNMKVKVLASKAN